MSSRTFETPKGKKGKKVGGREGRGIGRGTGITQVSNSGELPPRLHLQDLGEGRRKGLGLEWKGVIKLQQY